MPKLAQKRLALIACSVLWREFAYFASQSEHIISFYFQPQGLHLNPKAMRKKLQKVIDEIEASQSFDYLIFGYGICGGGVEGLCAKKTPMVFARAHDCLTFLIGSRTQHKELQRKYPDAYWFSPGWIETGAQPSKERIEKSFSWLEERYGKEKARWLLPQLESWLKNYHRAIYIDLGVGKRELYLSYAQKCAKELDWELVELEGDARLVKGLVFGEWKEKDFLIVPPRAELVLTLDEELITYHQKE